MSESVSAPRTEELVSALHSPPSMRKNPHDGFFLDADTSSVDGKQPLLLSLISFGVRSAALEGINPNKNQTLPPHLTQANDETPTRSTAPCRRYTHVSLFDRRPCRRNIKLEEYSATLLGLSARLPRT